MKTFSIAIATLLLGAAAALPLGAQLNITSEGTSDPSLLGDTVIFESQGLGQRVTQRLFLDFDSGDQTSITLRNIQIRGSQDFTYQLNGVSRLPAEIRGELTLDMFLSYHPRNPAQANATLELTLRVSGSESSPDLAVYTVNLVGRVPGYSLSYALPGRASQPVPPLGLIDFGHKPTMVTSEATVTLTNSGSGPGRVNAATVSGSSMFALVAPPTFPIMLEPGRSVNLQLGFTPTATLNFDGELTFDFGDTRASYAVRGIGGDVLSFSLLTYPHDSATPSRRVTQSGRPVIFGQGAARIELVGANTTRSSQLVQSIRVTGPFRVTASPTLPLTLRPGEDFAVRVEPAANAFADSTGQLIVDDAIFPLDIDTPPLPSVSFTRDGGTVMAGEEVQIGMYLSSPYTVDLTGTLTLDLETVEAANDPLLRWSTGGRQVNFEIPAGATRALLAGSAQTLSFFASSVAGTVAVRARLAAHPWGIDVTPATEPQARFAVEVSELPAVQFSRSDGVVGGGEEIRLGVSLESPYGEAVTGTLQMIFDEAVSGTASQPWSGPGQSVRFAIPAGATQAVFGDLSTSTVFTAPGVEGLLTAAAFFVEDSTGRELTPEDVPQVAFAVQIAELPAAQFSMASDSVSAGQDVELGLTLEEAYSEAVEGRLAVTFEPAEAGAVGQPWSGPGLQISFRIPDGGTAAVFAGGAAMAMFQAPGVSGTLTVTARFASEARGVNLTPSDAPEIEIAVVFAELPAVTFTRATTSLRGGEEAELGLRLDEPYREGLEGVLQLAFDGSGQVGQPWAGAGLQVRFQIPAGETAATFADGGMMTVFRAPTGEGRLRATARFSGEDTGLDLTPEDAPEVEYPVVITDLPNVTFSHAGGTVAAAEQMALTMTLAQPYPTDVVGVLTLAFETRTFVNDPAIQWASGGRQAVFLIRAGSTEPEFTGAVNANAFQTGTVAGEIVAAARFFSVPDGVENRVIPNPTSLAAAAADITPEPHPEVRFTVMESAPVLRSIVLGSTGQGGFTLQVTGYSTSRSVDTLSFVFSAASQALLRTTELSTDVTQRFSTYFSGNQAASFGSQFTATVAFTLDEGVFEDIAGVSATASNSLGESNPVSVSLN